MESRPGERCRLLSSLPVCNSSCVRALWHGVCGVCVAERQLAWSRLTALLRCSECVERLGAARGDERVMCMRGGCEQQRLHPGANCRSEPHYAGRRGGGACALESAQQQLAGVWRMPSRREARPGSRDELGCHGRRESRFLSRLLKGGGGRSERRGWRTGGTSGASWASWGRHAKGVDGQLQDAHLQELADGYLPVRQQVHLRPRSASFCSRLTARILLLWLASASASALT